MSERLGFPIWRQLLPWLVGNTVAGALVGLSVAYLLRGSLEWPVLWISILFANVVGMTVFLTSMLFPRIRQLSPLTGGALLVLTLAADALLGTVAVVLMFPLFILRDIRQMAAIGAINVLLALVVGTVVYVYEGLRLRLAASLEEVEQVRLVEARLREQAAEAKLAALQARINPHFFFNTLNTISSLLEEDVDEAEEVLQTLADLFRYTFKVAGAEPVPLREELDFTRNYLTIEQARFGDRLRVDWQVDEAAREIPVPGLILQPLVENAIGHGIAPREGGGTVTIRARVQEGVLRVEVRDDGPGVISRERVFREGHGLHNVRDRLQTRYGEAGAIELLTGIDGPGATARISIPHAAATAIPEEAR